MQNHLDISLYASKRPLFLDIRRRAAGVGRGKNPPNTREKRPLLAGNLGKKKVIILTPAVLVVRAYY